MRLRVDAKIFTSLFVVEAGVVVLHATAKRDSLLALSFGTEQMACASSPQTSLCKEEEEEKDIIMFDSYGKSL